MNDVNEVGLSERTYPGDWISDTKVKLHGGQIIHSITKYDDGTCLGFAITGTLYVSRDGGATWATSELRFRGA